MKTIFEEGSIQDYMDLIKEEVGYVKKLVIHCQWCPKELMYSCDCKTECLFKNNQEKN